MVKQVFDISTPEIPIFVHVAKENVPSKWMWTIEDNHRIHIIQVFTDEMNAVLNQSARVFDNPLISDLALSAKYVSIWSEDSDFEFYNIQEDALSVALFAWDEVTDFD